MGEGANSPRSRARGRRGAADGASYRASRARGAAAAWCAQLRGCGRTARTTMRIAPREHRRPSQGASHGVRVCEVGVMLVLIKLDNQHCYN